MEWKLKKIPKILHLYWGCNKKLSFMRYMTAYSFSKFNPDWKIVIYKPTITNKDEVWLTGEQKNNCFTGIDYFDLLHDINNVTIKEFDFSKIGISNNLPEVYKSDIFRLYILTTIGGVWSDFDILYLKPITDTHINTDEYVDKNEFVCYQHHYNSVGFLISKINSEVYKELFEIVKKISHNKQNDNYQIMGRYAFDNYFNGNYDKVGNISYETVYPIDPDNINNLFDKLTLNKNTVGIHWFAGAERTSEFENKITHDNINEYKDIPIFKLMENIYDILLLRKLKYRKNVCDKKENEHKMKKNYIKYSILMPYYKRELHLNNTLVSFLQYYNNRNDYEVLILEDRKNVNDEKEHKLLINLINKFKDKINIKHYETNFPGVNPCLSFNYGAKQASGEFLIITNPECFHDTDILKGMDLEFENSKNVYVVCDCLAIKCNTYINNYKEMKYESYAWYEHKTFNRNLHFCTGISKENYNKIDGFDENYRFGRGYDDDDFRNAIIKHKIPIINRDDLLVLHIDHNKEYDMKIEELTKLDVINKLYYNKKWNGTYYDIIWNGTSYNIIWK